MHFFSTALLVGGLAVEQTAATGWLLDLASKYSSPSNCNNQCSDLQKTGYDWAGLNPGQFTQYSSNSFSGFQCANSFGKRDLRIRSDFQSKCIKASLDDHPSITCAGNDAMSIEQYQVTSDKDQDIECHYDMPDGSKCTEYHSCKATGSVLTNKQCGGAKAVTFKPIGGGSNSGCSIGIHSIAFNCGAASTAVSAPTSTPTSTPAAYSTPSIAKAGEPSPPTYETDTTSSPVSPPAYTAPIYGGSSSTTTTATSPSPPPSYGHATTPTASPQTTSSAQPPPSYGPVPSPSGPPAYQPPSPHTTTTTLTTTPLPPPSSYSTTLATTSTPVSPETPTSSTPPKAPVYGSPSPQPPSYGTSLTTSSSQETTTTTPVVSPETTPHAPAYGPPPSQPSSTSTTTTTSAVPPPSYGTTPSSTLPTDTTTAPGTSTPPSYGTSSETSTTTTPSVPVSPTTTTSTSSSAPSSPPSYGGSSQTTTTTSTTTPEKPTTPVPYPPGSPPSYGESSSTTPTTTQPPPPSHTGPTSTPSPTTTSRPTSYTTSTTTLTSCGPDATASTCSTSPSAYVPPPGTEKTGGSTDVPPAYAPSSGTAQPTGSAKSPGPSYSTSTPPASPSTNPAGCPDVLPKCLNTWLWESGCGNNADSSCYCKNSKFVTDVMGCLQSWSSSSGETTEAVNYFQGICASYVPVNPALITACPTTPTTNTAGSYAPSSGQSAPTSVPAATTPPDYAETTLTLSSTITVPCTYTVGSSQGQPIPSSSTISTVQTTLTLPQVQFTTNTVTVGTTQSVYVGLSGGTPSINASPNPTAPAYGSSASGFASYVSQSASQTASGGGSPGFVPYTSAASRWSGSILVGSIIAGLTTLAIIV